MWITKELQLHSQNKLKESEMECTIDAIKTLENYSETLGNEDRLFVLWTTDIESNDIKEHIGNKLNDFSDILFNNNHLVAGYIIMTRLSEQSEKEFGGKQILSMMDLSTRAWRTFESNFTTFVRAVEGLNNQANDL